MYIKEAFLVLKMVKPIRSLRKLKIQQTVSERRLDLRLMGHRIGKILIWKIILAVLLNLEMVLLTSNPRLKH